MGNANVRLIPPEEELERALYQALAQARWELARGNQTPALQLAGTIQALSTAWRLRHRIPEGETPLEIRIPRWVEEVEELLRTLHRRQTLEEVAAATQETQGAEEETQETQGAEEETQEGQAETRAVEAATQEEAEDPRGIQEAIQETLREI